MVCDKSYTRCIRNPPPQWSCILLTLTNIHSSPLAGLYWKCPALFFQPPLLFDFTFTLIQKGKLLIKLSIHKRSISKTDLCKHTVSQLPSNSCTIFCLKCCSPMASTILFITATLRRLALC